MKKSEKQGWVIVNVITVLLMLGVLSICGVAMLVTGRDNACAEKGGTVSGIFGERCSK